MLLCQLTNFANTMGYKGKSFKLCWDLAGKTGRHVKLSVVNSLGLGAHHRSPPNTIETRFLVVLWMYIRPYSGSGMGCQGRKMWVFPQELQWALAPLPQRIQGPGILFGFGQSQDQAGPAHSWDTSGAIKVKQL